MIGLLRRGLLLALLLVGQVPAADAAGRVALVIGNGQYQGVTQLANPVNDARDVADKLRALGFTVVDGYDLGKRQMEQTIGEFSDQLDSAEAGVFYYAGHGIAVAGRNFIVPVDANLSAPAKLKFESISIDDLVELMKASTPVNVLILDACRNNPFGRGPAITTRGATDATSGLAAANSYAGAYTVYSAQDGAVALDGEGRNSPFATALLKHLDTPAATIEVVMGRVKAEVEEMTKGFQSPDAKGLLVQPFSFLPAEQLATRSVAAEPSPGDAESRALADVTRFVTERYLKPEPDNIEALAIEVFTDPATSFGVKLGLADMAKAKAQWFAQYGKWQLQMMPGSLKASFFDAESATVSFSLGYKYWPKQEDAPPQTGITQIVLGLVRQDGRWKIESEAAN